MKKVSLMALMLVAGANVNAANYYVGGKVGYAYQGMTDYKNDKNAAGKYTHDFNTTTGVRGSALYGHAFDYSVAAGVKADDMRFELEASSTTFAEAQKYGTKADGEDVQDDTNDKKGMDAKMATSLMSNVYYDIDLQKLAGVTVPVKPYVQAGLGFLHLDNKTKTQDGEYGTPTTEQLAAWSIGSGVSYEVVKNVTLDAGYKYLRSFSNKVDKADKNDAERNYDKTTQHSVMFGARYGF